MLLLSAALILLGSFFGYLIVLAVKGEGSATINGAGNATVERAVSNTFTVLLTVGASGITVNAANPTFTLPAGFTAPNASPVATLGEVVTDGQWFAVGGATCPVTMGSSGASGQVMTVDVTTVCTVGAGGKITLTYKGTSAVTMGATALTIMTADDAGVPTPAIALTGGSPTITVTDTAAPTVTVTMDDTVLNISDTALVTFTFSEAPTGFTTDDVTVANGSIGAINTTNPLIQTAIYTPTNGITDTTNVITVGTVWTDLAGNTGGTDDSPNYTIDTVAPTVTSITFSDSAIIIGDTPTVTIVMSEPVGSFASADVTVPNGTLGVLSTGDNITFTGTYTPNTIEDTTNVAVVATTFTDTAGNPASAGASSANYTIDTIAPTVTVTMDDAVLNISDTALVTFTFSEAPTGFTTDDVTVANGSIGAIDTSNPLIQTATYTPTNGITDTTNVITVGTVWTDLAGNTGGTDDSPNYTIETIAPTVTSGSSNGGGGSAYVQPPLIDVVKIPSPLALPDGPGLVTYTYALRNIGNVPMTNVKVIDDFCSSTILIYGDKNSDLKLATDETWTYRCSKILSKTQTNTVVVTAWANGIKATDIAIATVVVGIPVVPPLIHVIKIPDPLVLPAEGGWVTYTETITNPGTVPLSNVGLIDDKCSPLVYISGDLNADSKIDTTESWIYTCHVNITKTTTNTATAEGSGNGLIARDFSIVTVVVAPVIVVAPVVLEVNNESVSKAPKFPNTGFAPSKGVFFWHLPGTFILLFLLLLLAIQVIRKSRKYS